MGLDKLALLKIKDIMSRTVLTITANVTVREAANKMALMDVGAIPVVDKRGKLTGIFSERDLLRKVAADDKKLDDTPIGDVMTENPTTLVPDSGLSQALRIMQDGNFRHAPVIEGNSLIGIVSIKDLHKALDKVIHEALF